MPAKGTSRRSHSTQGPPIRQVGQSRQSNTAPTEWHEWHPSWPRRLRRRTMCAALVRAGPRRGLHLGAPPPPRGDPQAPTAAPRTRDAIHRTVHCTCRAAHKHLQIEEPPTRLASSGGEGRAPQPGGMGSGPAATHPWAPLRRAATEMQSPSTGHGVCQQGVHRQCPGPPAPATHGVCTTSHTSRPAVSAADVLPYVQNEGAELAVVH